MTWNPGSEPGSAPGSGDRILGRAGAPLWIWEPSPSSIWAAAGREAIVIGDGVDALSLLDAVSRKAARTLHYPLRADEAPTVYSLLGVLHYLRRGAVVFAVSPAARLLRSAYELIVEGRALDADMASGLTSPLHARLLWALEVMRRHGVDLMAEIERNKLHAFTGGDAARSDAVQLAADMALVDPSWGVCVVEAYRGRGCWKLQRLLEALDPWLEGAASVLAIEPEGDALVAYLGCRTLGLGDGCEREAAAAEAVLPELGVPVSRVEPVFPEEAACVAYRSLYSC